MECWSLKPMVMGSVWSQQNFRLLASYFRIGDRAAEKNQGRNRVGECVMPPKSGEDLAEILFQTEILNEVTEGEGFSFRPDGAGELQSIHPGTETVKGKRPQKTPFGGGTVGDKPPFLEPALDFRPELRQFRRPGKVLRADAMDLAGGPGDWLIGKEKAGEVFANLESLHQRDADLHGHVGASAANTRALKINGGKQGFGDDHAIGSADSRSHASQNTLVLRLVSTQQPFGHLPIHAGICNRDTVLKRRGVRTQRLASEIDIAFEHGTNDLPAP
jgi:hypothetical protein